MLQTFSAVACLTSVTMGLCDTSAYAAPSKPQPPHKPPHSQHTPPKPSTGPVKVPGYGKVTPNQIQAGLQLLTSPEYRQLYSLLPALLASMNTDAKVAASPELIADARANLQKKNVPPLVRKTGNSMLDFLYKRDPHGGLFPHYNNRVQSFLTPAVGKGCVAGAGNQVGVALAAAGPQKSPAPGPGIGQTGFVYTALGTGPAVFDPSHPLYLKWNNLESHRSGRVIMKPNHLINAKKGPGTFTSIVNTGTGRVVATIEGTVTTRTGKHGHLACNISPTMGLIRV